MAAAILKNGAGYDQHPGVLSGMLAKTVGIAAVQADESHGSRLGPAPVEKIGVSAEERFSDSTCSVTAAIKDFGIDDKSLAAIQSRLQPNSSALLVLGRARDRDAYVARLRTFDPQVVSTTLTPEVEAELRRRLDA